MLVDTVVPNLIIIGGAKRTRVSRSIPLQLSVDSNLAIAVKLVKVSARPRLLIDKAYNVAVDVAAEEFGVRSAPLRPLCFIHLVLAWCALVANICLSVGLVEHGRSPHFLHWL